MKTNINFLEKINKEELDKLAREIKETLALEHAGKNKTFTSIDLWNIQRRKKISSTRRNLA